MKRVLLVAASQRKLNRNTLLLDHVAEAFAERLGADNVHRSELQSATEALPTLDDGFVLLFGSALPDECDYQPLAALARARGLPSAFWTTEDPYEFDAAEKYATAVDLVFTNDKWTSKNYAFYGAPRVQHLPLAACPKHHWREIPNSAAEFRYDVFFCGVGFSNRQAIIDGLHPVLSRVETLICGSNWIENAPYVQNGRMSADELFDAYRRSRIVLNLSRDHFYANDRFKVTPSTPGPRTFEAAMAGAFQLAFADRPELLDYYRHGSEIVLFDGLESARRAIEYYLEHSEERRSVARAARERTLVEHCYTHRVDVILARIRELVGARAA